MNCRIALALLSFALLLGSASAAYELCDSVERNPDLNLFRCNLTTTKIDFTQQDIDNFWEKLKTDGDYTNGRIGLVEWTLKNMVIEVSDDLRFVEPEGMDIAWDIVMDVNVNNVLDINVASGIIAARPGNQTAIKKAMGSLPEYLISFAPSAGRRSIRNITIEKPAGALDVYILGSSIKKMEVDLEGELSISGGHFENIDTLKAKKISISNKGYIFKANSIEAESISLDGQSYIRNVGIFGETAIRLTGTEGLSMKGKSYIDGIVGGIESYAGISLLDESRIENGDYAASNTIQWIKAAELALEGKSAIKGFGGQPGQITVSGQFSLDNSFIAGKQENKPRGLTAKSISLSNNAYLTGFLDSINVTGKETFSLESGASIKEFAGTINSCAPLSMDGNTTKIIFTSGGAKAIKAKDLVLDNNAEIYCVGDQACEYSFARQTCNIPPSATLNVISPLIGNLPLAVEFAGECDGKGSPVTCTIRFGDANASAPFDGNASHTYETAGTFTAVLTASNAEGQEAESEKVITILEPGTAVPAGNLQISASKQSVKPGEEISISIACEGTFESFLIQNDLGLPPITNAPEGCPATFGPFAIPGNATAGEHSFTVSGKLAGSEPFSQTAKFTVEGGFPFLSGFSFDLIMQYGVIALGLVVVVILALAILAIKKRKAKKKAPSAEKEYKAPAAEKNHAWATHVTEKKSDDVPPWLRAEKEEEGAEETAGKEAQPAEEEKTAEETSGKTLEEAQPKSGEESNYFAGSEEKPEGEASLEEKAEAKGDISQPAVPEAFMYSEKERKEKPAEGLLFLPKKEQGTKPAGFAAKKQMPALEFRDLVEKLKETGSGPLPAEEKEAVAEEPKIGRGDVDWNSLEKELFGAQPKKKPGEGQAKEENIAAGQEPFALGERKAMPGSAKPLPAEKPAEGKKTVEKKRPFFSFKKKPAATAPQAGVPAKPVLGQEQQKPETDLSKKMEEEQKLPPWLKKKR